jgi:hypothetical protein
MYVCRCLFFDAAALFEVLQPQTNLPCSLHRAGISLNWFAWKSSQ